MPKTKPAGEKRDNPVTVHCRECGHEFVLPLKLPMDADRFATLMKGVRCYSCGGKDLEI